MQASIVAALESDFAKVQALVEEAVRHLSARPGTGSTVRGPALPELTAFDQHVADMHYRSHTPRTSAVSAVLLRHTQQFRL